MKAQGYIYVNAEGKYLVMEETQTHTGRHIHVRYTSELNEASILPPYFHVTTLDKVGRREASDLQKLHQLPAEKETVVTVRILPKEPDPEK